MTSYTGIIHAHSTYSYDGKCSLPELKTLLQTQGHAFVCMSEHTDELTPQQMTAFVAECRALSDDSFVFVPGLEIPYGRTHILLLGCTAWVGQAAADAAALRAAASATTLTILAHPVRNNFVVDDVVRDVIDGVEVWNQQYDGKAAVRPRAAQLLQQLRRTRPDLIATAGIDFHRPEHLGAPIVTLDLDELTESTILTAVTSGHFSFHGHSAHGPLQLSVINRIKSLCTITIITLGKRVNAVLAACGLSLPTSWRRALRARL